MLSVERGSNLNLTIYPKREFVASLPGQLRFTRVVDGLLTDSLYVAIFLLVLHVCNRVVTSAFLLNSP